jgi:hypothetical protein
MLGYLRGESHTPFFEIINCILQTAFRSEGYYRPATSLCALRFAPIKPDVEPISINLGPQPVPLNQRETQSILIEIERPLNILFPLLDDSKIYCFNYQTVSEKSVSELTKDLKLFKDSIVYPTGSRRRSPYFTPTLCQRVAAG